MKKFKQIKVIDPINLTDEAKQEIQELSESPVYFPNTSVGDENEVIERIGTAEAVLGNYNSNISKNTLDNCPNIKYIGICGTNLTGIDVDEAKKRGITVTNVTDYGDEATTEYIFAQLLMLARGFDQYQWQSEPCELNGKTIGIVGLGAVGKQVARLALGFNMRVLYTSLTKDTEWESKGLEFCELSKLLQESDIITLHVPKNTRVLGEKEFALIKNNAVLVDVCLGMVMNLNAFKKWIGRGRNFAIFDNVKGNLLDGLKGVKNVIGLNRDTAAKTLESRERLSKKVLDNLNKFLNQF